MTLDQLPPGQRACVKRIEGQGAIRRRLMEMGLIKGTVIETLKTAPLGDPVEYKLRGYHLSLRRNEAQLVVLE